MRLDHIAYRVRDREAALHFFQSQFGYELVDEFDLNFDDGTTCECYALSPPEQSCGKISLDIVDETQGQYVNAEYHAPPQIFISEGQYGSIVQRWVDENGPGIHHLAYEVPVNESIYDYIGNWEDNGYTFSSEPVTCEDGSLTQVFSDPHPITGMVYELIQKTQDKGFCAENVKELMESTE